MLNLGLLKYLPFVFCGLIVIACIGVIHYQTRIYDKLLAENVDLQGQLYVAGHNLAQCNATINRQNAELAAYTFDMENAEKRYAMNLASLNERLGAERVQIVRELVRDPSCENELFQIKQQLMALYE